MDYDNPVYINPLIGKERMKYLYKKAYWDYYTCFKVWAYCLKGLARDGGIGRYARGLNAMQAMMFNNIWEFVKEVNFIKRAKKIFL